MARRHHDDCEVCDRKGMHADEVEAPDMCPECDRIPCQCPD